MADVQYGKVFITSGTGVIGYRVAKKLLEVHSYRELPVWRSTSTPASLVKHVRVGVWKGDKQNSAPGEKSLVDEITEELAGKGAEIIDFDWSNPDGFKAALEGVTTVFCTIPHMDHWADCFPAFIRACKQARVEHFVKVSFLRNTEASETYRKNVPFVQFHSTCDDLLEQVVYDSIMKYTILACSHLMSTPLLHQGKLLTDEQKYVTASYGMGVNYVSPNDVAKAAVVVIGHVKEHKNKLYNLTGRRAIMDSDVAILLSKKYGKPIQHIQLGYHEYKKDVKSRGLPSWLVKDSAEFERMKAYGLDELPSSYTKDLEKLIGSKPESFEEYLGNKSEMRPGLKFSLPN